MRVTGSACGSTVRTRAFAELELRLRQADVNADLTLRGAGHQELQCYRGFSRAYGHPPGEIRKNRPLTTTWREASGLAST